MAVNLDPNEVMIGTADGPGLYVGPPGTDMPADLSAIDAAWLKLGYVSEDGPAMSQEVESDSITPWQGRSAVKTFVKSREFSMSFTLIQVNEVTVSMYFDQPEPTATSGAFDMEIRDDVAQREYAVLVVIADDVQRVGIQFGYCTLTEGGELPFKKEGATEFPITLGATSDAGLVGKVKKEMVA